MGVDAAAVPASLDLALRASLATLAVFLAALAWRDRRRAGPGRLLAALALGVAAYALQSSPQFWHWPAWLRMPLAVLSTGNAVVFWLFSRAVFDDGFRLRPVHALPWALLAGAALAYRVPGWRPALDAVITAGTAAFAALAAVQTLASWRADLVERRRRLRVFVVAAGALYTLVNMGMRLLPSPVASWWQGPADLLVLAAIVVAAAWPMVHFSTSVLAPRAAPPDPTAAAASPAADDSTTADPDEAALLAALDLQMRVEQVYREEGLTIAGLARRLDVPEYRLRRAINRRLGHRNFNAFLNGHRIADVSRALADPARAGEPVLTLALEAGFQSPGPFNRAFKAETGQTPTEYRRAKLGR